MSELSFDEVNCRLYSDNQSLIHLTKNSTFHSVTKHIHLRYNDTQLKFVKIEVVRFLLICQQNRWLVRS